MYNKNFHLKSKYLISCDVINKYNFLSYYDILKIDSLMISINLKNVLNTLDSKIDNSNEFEVKMFILYYLLFKQNSYICLKELKQLKIKKSVRDLVFFYELKQVLKKNFNIYSLLEFLKFNSFIKNINHFINDDKITYTFNIYFNNSILFNDISRILALNFNLREFFINITFSIKSKQDYNKSLNIIKLLVPFWIKSI